MRLKGAAFPEGLAEQGRFIRLSPQWTNSIGGTSSQAIAVIELPAVRTDRPLSHYLHGRMKGHQLEAA
jgi:hypothetical protein